MTVDTRTVTVTGACYCYKRSHVATNRVEQKLPKLQETKIKLADVFMGSRCATKTGTRNSLKPNKAEPRD